LGWVAAGQKSGTRRDEAGADRVRGADDAQPEDLEVSAELWGVCCARVTRRGCVEVAEERGRGTGTGTRGGRAERGGVCVEAWMIVSSPEASHEQDTRKLCRSHSSES